MVRRQVALASALLVLLAAPALAQSQGILSLYGPTLPPECAIPQTYILTSSAPNFYICSAPNVWTNITPANASAFEAGDIVFTLTACRAGFVEVAGLDGRVVMGTRGANGNVGTTGGADTVTPTATGAAVTAHTGTAVADHPAHTHTFTQSSNATTPDLVQALTSSPGVAASGTSGNPSATLTHAVTQPAAHVVTQPTISRIDNRSAFLRLIACQKT